MPGCPNAAPQDLEDSFKTNALSVRAGDRKGILLHCNIVPWSIIWYFSLDSLNGIHQILEMKHLYGTI